jgi:hypothetical protein
MLMNAVIKTTGNFLKAQLNKQLLNFAAFVYGVFIYVLLGLFIVIFLPKVGLRLSDETRYLLDSLVTPSTQIVVPLAISFFIRYRHYVMAESTGQLVRLKKVAFDCLIQTIIFIFLLTLLIKLLGK